MREFLTTLFRRTHRRMVLIGSHYDMDDRYRTIVTLPFVDDMVGKTTLDEALAIMKGVRGVIGTPSGVVIAATVEGAKTVCLWHKLFHFEFAKNMVPPGSDYLPIDVVHEPPNVKVVEAFLELE